MRKIGREASVENATGRGERDLLAVPIDRTGAA